MEIRLQVIHKSEFAVVEETKIIPMETYDYYSFPEDFLLAYISEMRTKVEKEIPLAEARGKEFVKKFIK